MPTINRINEPTSYFEYDQHGVSAVSQYKDKNNKALEKTTYISTACFIDEKIVNEENAVYYKIRHFDNEREIINYFTANEVMGSSSSRFPAAIDTLIKNGLIINSKCDSLFIEYLKTVARTIPETKGTNKAGWHDNEYFHAGYSTSNSVLYTGRSMVLFKTKGSREKQFDLWDTILRENPLVLLITAFCMSGTFSRFIDIGEANTIWALTGPSSKGKTLAEQFATSSYTDPSRFASFNATANSLEHTVHQHKDLFVCLDEVHQSKMKLEDRIGFIYDLANGRAKNRMFKLGDNYTTKDIGQDYYSILLSGEKSILNGLKQTIGSQVRLVEIVLDNDVSLWESINSSTEAEELTKALSEDYGHIMPEFIEYIKPKLSNLQSEYYEVLERLRNTADSSSNAINRKLKPIARALLAARYLLEVVLTDKSDIEAILESAMTTVNKVLLATFIDMDEASHEFYDLLSHIQNTHQNYFLTGETSDANKREVFGSIMYDNANNKKIIKIFNNCFDDFVLKAKVPGNLFLKWLKEQKLLKQDAAGRSTISRDGKRYYWIEVPKVFFNDDEPHFEQQAIPMEDKDYYGETMPADPFSA